MPDGRRVKCRDCGKHKDEVGPISWRGYCGTCGHIREVTALDELHYHRGPTFKNWRRSIAASVGAVLLDDVHANE